MRPERPLVSLLAALLVAGVVLAACAERSDDEVRLRERLNSMEAAIEQGRVGDFMQAVAEDFTSARGGMNRAALGLLLRRERLARQSISVQRSNLAIQILAAGRARLEFHALVTGGSGWLPSEGRLWAIDTGWRLDDDDEWRLVSADWRPVLGAP